MLCLTLHSQAKPKPALGLPSQPLVVITEFVAEAAAAVILVVVVVTNLLPLTMSETAVAIVVIL